MDLLGRHMRTSETQSFIFMMGYEKSHVYLELLVSVLEKRGGHRRLQLAQGVRMEVEENRSIVAYTRHL